MNRIRKSDERASAFDTDLYVNSFGEGRSEHITSTQAYPKTQSALHLLVFFFVFVFGKDIKIAMNDLSLRVWLVDCCGCEKFSIKMDLFIWIIQNEVERVRVINRSEHHKLRKSLTE